jgi:DNA-binding NtrC family response regulator
MQATATAAGLSRRTLLRVLKRLGIDRRRFRRGPSDDGPPA